MVAARLPAFLLLLLLAAPAAADVTARATLDRGRITVGESVDLAIEVNGSQEATPPGVAAPDGLTMRYVGPSTQVSITNGKMSQSIAHHYTVVPQRAGSFTIGPIVVEVGGSRLDAGSVTLQVVAAGTRPGTPAAGTGPLRLLVSTDRQAVYLHERLSLKVKLLVGNVRVADLQYPTIPGEGFALDKLAEPQQRQERTSEGNFQTLEFQVTMTPLRSGALTIGPARMGLNVLESGRGDPFFGRFFGQDPFAQRRPVEVQSEALVLNVLPLPEEGRPADFSGAVGRFELDVKAGPLDVAVGDPVTVTIGVRGTGNLDNATAPVLAAGDAFRLYPPQVTTPPNAQQVERVFEQVVIPERAGPLALPEIRFSYFDPGTRAYRTLTHAPIALAVRPGTGPAGAPQMVGGRPLPAAEEPLGRDIVALKDDPGTLTARGTRLWRSSLFWAWQPIPLLAWLGAWLRARRRRRLTGDVRYARFTHAGREARRALAAARTAAHAGDRAAFYDMVSGAVRDYLAAKLDLPPGGVTPEAVAGRLNALGARAAVADELRTFLATCEQVRFAPGAVADGDVQPTLARASAIIRTCERERRLGRTLAVLVLAVGSLAAAAAPESPRTAFFQAGTLYAEGRFPEAAAAYERIAAGGVESGALWFNMGNAYFRAGDAGRAILDYERARVLAPRDPDVAANLGFARGGTLEEDPTPLWARFAFPLAGRMSGDELFLAASAAYTLAMALLAAGCLLPAPPRTLGWAATAAGVVAAVALGSGVYRLATIELPPRAVVIATQPATVRFEPTPTGTAHFSAPPGTVLRVLATREGWSQVRRADGTRGWVEDAALAAL